MKAHIRHIGIVSHEDSVHAVSFTSGVNVITGKSSTGKSAMIEIFDYCFGSEDFTVPDGVITENSVIYFVVLKVKESNLVLARRTGGRDAFVREESDDEVALNKNAFKASYFIDDYFMPLPDFKKEVGRYFGLVITDVDENEEQKYYQGGRKSPTPSIRSFSSFMLQHQGLVANKHAIFYRFDQKEKRDQAIEHFKIFAGFADQAYFLKSQELNNLKVQARQIEQEIPREGDAKREAAERLEEALHEYSAITGTFLQIGTSDEVLRNPMRSLEQLKSLSVTVVPLSDEHAQQREEHERQKARLIAELRKRQNKLTSINSSIDFAQRYTTDAAAVQVPSSAELQVSECPFCGSSHHAMEHEANRLEDAISWLNQELRRTPYLLESFLEDQRRTSDEIGQYQIEIGGLDEKIKILDGQISELERYKSQGELGLRAKWHVENIIEELLSQKDQKLDSRLSVVREEIESLTRFLKEHYDTESKLKHAEEYIQAEMAEIGNRFDFEESYRPINLKFSLSTFDLWHETSEGRKVFLRSMGSGANWLYCHLTLFLALHRYFCSLGDSCSVPSILFFDQPSQVYFPSVIDNDVNFDPEKLAELEGASRKRTVDEDIRAVEGLYSELVRFCRITLEKTGIEPQLIVTDHADNLILAEDVQFDSLVRARWRDRGFIELPKDS
jgi:hypothetical protein